jgi:glutathione S-transferase-like protein
VAARFPLSAPAITRHLQVLETAGLIERRIDAAGFRRQGQPRPARARLVVELHLPCAHGRRMIPNRRAATRSQFGRKVIPEDPKLAAQVEQWVSLGNTVFDPVMIRQYVVGYVFPKDGKPDMAAIGAAVETMKKQVDVLDRAVAATGHLVGEEFTLADINLMPILFYVGRFEEGKALLA